MSNLQLSLLGAVAEFERSMTRERQWEGIATAKKAGAYKGRKRRLTAEQVQVICKRVGQENGSRVWPLSTLYRGRLCTLVWFRSREATHRNHGRRSHLSVAPSAWQISAQ